MYVPKYPCNEVVDDLNNCTDVADRHHLELLSDVAWLMLMFTALLPLWFSQRDYELQPAGQRASTE
jgi:hypothetical protein